MDEGGKQLVEILHPEGIQLGTQNYASMGSIFLHLFRDWCLTFFFFITPKPRVE